MEPTKRNLALTALKNEIEQRFKKQCDECTAKHKQEHDFREKKHAKEFAQLHAQKESDRNYYDRKTDEYHKQLSTNWRRSKFYWKYVVVIFCLCVAIAGNVVFCVHYVKNTRKMNVYNNSLKFMHDMYPNAGIKQVIRIFERQEIDTQRHKLMNDRIENYEELWWLKE
jgi:hypothetical protein